MPRADDRAPKDLTSTNYFDTFIAVADDCPATTGGAPPARASGKTVARLQYDLVAGEPYAYTSDDVLFLVHAARSGIAAEDDEARRAFFSKSRACLRSSPLGKRYGWGIHFDARGKVAVHAVESEAYCRLEADPGLTQLRAMRSRRQ